MSNVIGQKIVKVRPMTTEEMEKEGWDYGNGTVIELENGVLLYPSRDEEGNGPGVIFGAQGQNQFYLFGKE